MTQSHAGASTGAQPLPEVLDLLIVGGGPGGTAAAFRARELGLAALVIDHDDLMKRIRDYSKEKLILPGFGGGDRMKFPCGGELIDCLRFAAIDKDEMCVRWKELYRRHEVPVRVGIELAALECRGDGVWTAAAWDHGARAEVCFLARHVVLAIGRGVPRRFDIPGNTEGIAFRLTDPGAYTGRPACVIGGGTSAAEAVIAVSNAKVAAADPTAVYWSYRGDRMPRVSKALAEVFFEAYVGNGNIRYFPRSEPAAIVTGEDHKEYLAIRVDRRRMEGRPTETSHLEFPKESCIACIGEDIPETLLDSCGIHFVTGGPRNKRRPVVNRWLESVQPNLYLIGDLLCQAYFETDDFNADPSGFREVKHRGNIKSALRDGVLVAGVIAQRLEGRTEIDVEVGDAEELERVPPVVPSSSAGGGTDEDRAGPQAAEPASTAALIRILPGDVEENEYPLRRNAVTAIGRGECDVSFPDDPTLSALHASVSYTEAGCFLRDDGSETGVFLRVPATRKLELGDGDLIRAGRQFLLFSRTDGRFSFTHYGPTGAVIGSHALPSRTIVLGRDAPDICLDAGDKILSRRQLALSAAADKVLVKDLKSLNGTYLRVREATRLEHADQFQVGQQRFAVNLEGGAVIDAAPASAPSVVVRPVPVSSDAPTGEAAVTFKGLGTFPAAPGQTICDVAEANGVAITAECHSGICGSDPIRILSGREHLDAEPDAGEGETLEDLCDLKPGECRLACRVRVKGPVEVEIL